MKKKSVFDHFDSATVVGKKVGQLIEREFPILTKKRRFITKCDTVRENSNLIEIPIARYDHNLSEIYKNKSYIRTRKGDVFSDVGGKYGILSGNDEYILLEVLPKFKRKYKGWTVIFFSEKEILEKLNKIPSGKAYKDLQDSLLKIFTTSITYNKYKFIKNKETSLINCRDERFFLFEERNNKWLAIVNPLFADNLYDTIISTKTIKKLSHPRWRKAYRLLKKGLGKSGFYCQTIKNLEIVLSIVIKKPSRRKEQLIEALVQAIEAFRNEGVLINIEYRGKTIYFRAKKGSRP